MGTLTRRSALIAGVGLLAGCGRRERHYRDRPQAFAGVTLTDVVFRSSALGRDMRYRVAAPSQPAAAHIPVVYLLHGGDGDFRDWTNYSGVARYAADGLVLVMPQGDNSYYVNAERSGERYEDYIVDDLAAHVEARFPVAAERSHRAIAGISMGGFGAVKIALSHPDRFVFAGAMSPAIDVARRRFSGIRAGQWWRLRAIFGPWDSEHRRCNDPFVLVHTASPAKAPYLYLTCGDREGLLAPVREFAAVADERHLPHEFHTARGGHDWAQWNREIPGLFAALSRMIR